MFALTVAGCKSAQVNPSVSKGTVSKGSSSTAPSSSSPAATKEPTVGDTVTVTGLTGEKISITLLKVLDPAQQDPNSFDQPASGKKFVAPQFEVKNVGSAVYDDAPLNDVSVFSSTNEQYGTTIVTDLTAGAMLGASGSLRLSPGQSAVGYVVCEVPMGAKVSRVQYTPSSGFSNQTAQWTVQ